MSPVKFKTLFLAVLMALSFAVNASAAIVDKIAIIVNEEVITEGEIERLVLPSYERMRSVFKGSDLLKKLEDVRQDMIQQLISEKLMLSEAKKTNIEVPEAEVNERIEDAMKHFDGSRAKFEAALAQQKMSLKELKNRYWEQMMVRKIIDKNIGSKMFITPVEVSNYYTENLQKFSMPVEVKLSNILIKPDMAGQKKLDLAKEIVRRLREGGDFAGLAKIYSEGPNAADGGLMGFVKKGDLLPEIERVVFSMKAGEISGIVQSSLGYHIFKVEERRESRTLPMAEARRDIEEAVYKEKMQKKIKEWVEALKKNAYIAFK